MFIFQIFSKKERNNLNFCFISHDRKKYYLLNEITKKPLNPFILTTVKINIKGIYILLILSLIFELERIKFYCSLLYKVNSTEINRPHLTKHLLRNY